MTFIQTESQIGGHEGLGNRELLIFLFLFLFLFFLFVFLRFTPAAYGGSQARSLIGAIAASLRYSHSNTKS